MTCFCVTLFFCVINLSKKKMWFTVTDASIPPNNQHQVLGLLSFLCLKKKGTYVKGLLFLITTSFTARLFSLSFWNFFQKCQENDGNEAYADWRWCMAMLRLQLMFIWGMMRLFFLTLALALFLKGYFPVKQGKGGFCPLSWQFFIVCDVLNYF